MPQLMQLEEGLTCCNLLSSVRNNPKVLEPILSQNGCNNQYTSDEFLDQVTAEFSSSQIRKNKEIDVYKYFCDFIVDLNVPGGGMYIFS
jgi:hypothetical protein